MAWNTMDAQVASYSAGQIKSVYFPSVTTVAGRLTDLNAAGVGNYGQMATPAAIGSGGTLHAAGDAGFMPIASAAGGAELRLDLFAPGIQTPCSLSIYERIWSCSGMSGTSTSAQTITSFPSLSIPDANGTGLELFWEVFTQIGTTATTITASYTNSANTSGRTSIASNIGATGLREVYRMGRMPLQVGDGGVKSIASATLAGTTGTAGDFGLVLAKKLFTVECGVAFGAETADFADLAIPLVDNTAALMFVCMASTTTSGIVDGTLVIGEA